MYVGKCSPRCVEHESGPVGFHRSRDHSIKQSLLQQLHITCREKKNNINLIIMIKRTDALEEMNEASSFEDHNNVLVYP